jgi:hypothetical protein
MRESSSEPAHEGAVETKKWHTKKATAATTVVHTRLPKHIQTPNPE